TKWPPSLKEYVSKVFDTCPSNKRDMAEKQMKDLITRTIQSGAMWTTDWEGMALPDYCVVTKPTNGVEPMIVSEDSPNLGSSDEINRRQQRALRFQSSAEIERQKALQSITAQKAREEFLKAGAEGNPDVVDWDEHTIIGTSQQLEKRYLRLTSAPDPSTVRPLTILERALEFVCERWKQERNYAYVCDQLKSIRQDLTVQRIKNAFSVTVYERHGRIALEMNDLGEFNQCQSQLMMLYELGLGTSEGRDEYVGYRILYMILTNNQMISLLSSLTPPSKYTNANIHPCISHALSVRTAVSLNDYHRFFKLYLGAPRMSGYLMDTFLERVRVSGMRVVCRGYRPSMRVDWIAKEFGWVADEDDKLRGEEECRKWLDRAGVVWDEEPTVPGAVIPKGKKAKQRKLVKNIIKCKESLPAFIRMEEETRRKGVDIKGQI
ncbi:SAC3/GANP/Nin1/mts3/eIF-3 p25 family-domain-containing protein, partial [Gaertneriomyces semiglobifer]